MSSPENPYPPQGPSTGGPPPAWPGSMPPPAGGFGPAEPAAPPPRPGTVVAAVIFWMLSGLVMVLSGVLSLAVADDPQVKRALTDTFGESEVQISDQTVENLLVASGWATIVVGLLLGILGAILLGGANWVRVLITVLGVVGVLLVLLPALFVLIAMVLQFVPASNAWFKAKSAEGRAS